MNIDKKDAIRQVTEMIYGGPKTDMYLRNIVKNFSEKTWDTSVRLAVAEVIVEYDGLLPEDPENRIIHMLADDPCARIRELATEMLDLQLPQHRAICDTLLLDDEEIVVEAAKKVRELLRDT